MQQSCQTYNNSWYIDAESFSHVALTSHRPAPGRALVASGSLELDARLAAIALPGMQRRISPGAADADALVDDRAPLEYLGQESLRRASLVLRGEVAP